LRCIPEFNINSKGTTLLVIAKEIGDGIPALFCGGSGYHDDVEELRRERAIYLGENYEFITTPVGSGRGVRRGALGEGVGRKAIATKRNELKLMPFGVVGVLKIKGDGDEGLD
jgi:hypothetical protein